MLINHYNDVFKAGISSEATGRDMTAPLAHLNLSHERIKETVEAFIHTPEFYPEPKKGAIRAVRKLKTKYHLVIISARPHSIKKLTEDWLTRHFQAAFSSVEFVGAAKWGEGNLASKENVLRRHSVSILIDDHFDHCKAAVSIGIQTILFGDYNWNRSASLTAEMTRAKDWSEVERILLP